MKWFEHDRDVKWCKEYLDKAIVSPYEDNRVSEYGESYGDSAPNFDAVLDFLGYDEKTAEEYGFRFYNGTSDDPELMELIIPTSEDDFVFIQVRLNVFVNKGVENRRLALEDCFYGSRYQRVFTKEHLEVGDILFVVSDVREAIQVNVVGAIAFAPKYDRTKDFKKESREDFRVFLRENSSAVGSAPGISVVVSSTYFDVEGIMDVCAEFGVWCVVRAIFKGDLHHVDALRKRTSEFASVLSEAIGTIRSPFSMKGRAMLSSTMYFDGMKTRGGKIFKSFISTGFLGLDAKLGGGFRKGLVIVAAEHGLGKTSLVLQMASTMANAGNIVLMYSLEMDPQELLARCVSRQSYEHLGKSGMTFDEVIHVLSGEEAPPERRAHCEEMLSLISPNLHLTRGKYDVRRIREEVDEAVECGYGKRLVVIVDYLQNMEQEGRNVRDSIEKSVDGLAEMCHVHRIPGIVISGINRDGYGKPFDESCLRESGKIEYDATVVLGLQFSRVGNEKFDRDAEKDKATQELDVVIRKNRYGDSRGVVKLLFHRAYSTFTESQLEDGAVSKESKNASVRLTRSKQISRPSKGTKGSVSSSNP